MSTLVSIVYRPEDAPQIEGGFTRVPLGEARLVVGRGIEGDAKGATRTRQLNVMARATVDALASEGFRAGPGELGEQLIIDGVDIDGLPAGSRLLIGATALVEIAEPRTGCAKFERYQGRRREETMGRLGRIARVAAEGVVRVGDAVQVLPAGGAASA